MRKPKALVIPFRFREGYPDEIVDKQTQSCIDLINTLDVDFDRTHNVIFPFEADLVKTRFNPNIYDFLILLVPTWIEPVLVMRALSGFKDKPVVVWGAGTFDHKGERVGLGSIPGSGVVKGTQREMGIFHQYIYHLPGDEILNRTIREKIQLIANVSRAISLMNDSRILTIGYLFAGMALGDIDFMKMKRDLGPEIVEFDSYSLIRLMEKQDLDGDEFKKNVAEITASLGSPLGKRLEKITCMYSAIKELIVKAYANAVTIKCNFELSQEFGLTACIPLSVLGNQIVASCEADIPAVLTQLLLHFLSDGKVSTYADIHEILDDRILVAACGFAPGAMCIDQKVIPDMPSDNPEGLGATFGDYITNKNYFNPGQVTMCRLLKEPDGKFSFHAARGVAVGNVGRVSEIGCPQYPFTEIRLSTDVDTFAQNLGSHHYAIVYGDLSRELDLFCQIKGMNLILE